MVNLSMANCECHNQMVYPLVASLGPMLYLRDIGKFVTLPEVWTRTELGESSLEDFEVGNLVTFHLRQFPHDWLGNPLEMDINERFYLVLMGTASVNVGLSIALFDYQRLIPCNPPKSVLYIYIYISFGTFDRLLKGVIPKSWVLDWFAVGFLKI